MGVEQNVLNLFVNGLMTILLMVNMVNILIYKVYTHLYNILIAYRQVFLFGI